MDWEQLRNSIYSEIQPGHRGLLKCQGEKRRAIISNDGNKISIQTGKYSKTITYEMIQYAFNKIEIDGEFDSKYFRKKYTKEYDIASCRYSMVGGVLVELDLVERISNGKNSCIYKSK